ncbi:hypothetical protein D5R93_02340 [Actinomyces lilanjuaniae]|uniref:Uncharacterized protein n=1 Tax=Actinomyces lilanjuaniae TaxID=2321394 RepID=A0ABN5PLU5_9ACTO|nr:hypothetical protein D5R93_02340 [Actinomyces lilanjuaniae]
MVRRVGRTVPGLVVVLLFSWVGVGEVLLLRWPVAAVVGLLAWELVVQAWWWLDGPLGRARGLALRAADALMSVALLLLPGPVRSLVLSVEGIASPRLDELVDRAVALAASGDRLVATVGALLVLRLVVHAVVRLADRATERVADRDAVPRLGVARRISAHGQEP